MVICLVSFDSDLLIVWFFLSVRDSFFLNFFILLVGCGLKNFEGKG